MLIFSVSLGFLLLGFILQLFFGRKHFSCKLFKYLFFCFAIFIVSYYFYLVYAQFYAWKNSGPPANYLVPPYRSMSYVFGYHFIRFALYYCISLIIALVFLLWMQKTNKRFDGKFFEDEEPYLAALSIFLLGNFNWNYAWIFYIISVFAFYLMLHFFLTAKVLILSRFNTFQKIRIHLNKLKEKILRTFGSVSEHSGQHSSDATKSEFSVRLSMYWLWLPSAILIIIVLATRV